MQQKLQEADCQSAAGYHPAPLWLMQIPLSARNAQ
jgi:hypothetical protein